MPSDPRRNASEMLSRIRRLEDEGQVNEAMALARDAAGTMPAAYDWSAELARLENEGKLARPYREGVEALGEGDYEDAQRLLSWVSGKNPRYREVARYLYWATNGRDPEVGGDTTSEEPPPSLLSGGHGPLGSPLVWVMLVAFGAVGFGLGWALKPGGEPEVEELAVASPAGEAPATTEPAPSAPAEAPAVDPTASAATSAAPVAAPSAPAAVAAASTASADASRSTARTTTARSTSDPSVSDVENPNLMSEADTLALSCQGGSAAACFKVGDSYYFGRGVARDISAAVRYYSKACDGGEARGCYNAADMVEKGESVPKDKQKAKSLFKRGCDLGDPQSCSRKEFLELETTEVP